MALGWEGVKPSQPEPKIENENVGREDHAWLPDDPVRPHCPMHRFLGLPVTHGCVRLDDDDMQFVFKTLTHGSKIYIY